jgi:hypothetical protein
VFEVDLERFEVDCRDFEVDLAELPIDFVRFAIERERFEVHVDRFEVALAKSATFLERLRSGRDPLLNRRRKLARQDPVVPDRAGADA